MTGALLVPTSFFTTSTYPLPPGRLMRFPPWGGGVPGFEVKEPPPQPVNRLIAMRAPTRIIRSSCKSSGRPVESSGGDPARRGPRNGIEHEAGTVLARSPAPNGSNCCGSVLLVEELGRSVRVGADHLTTSTGGELLVDAELGRAVGTAVLQVGARLDGGRRRGTVTKVVLSGMASP